MCFVYWSPSLFVVPWFVPVSITFAPARFAFDLIRFSTCVSRWRINW